MKYEKSVKWGQKVMEVCSTGEKEGKKHGTALLKGAWYGALAMVGILTIYCTDTDRFTAAYILVAILWVMSAITFYANR